MSFPLFPRTLLWRTFITFAITMVLALGAWLQIFRYFQEPARARDLAQMVASVVNLTRTALLNADPTRRADLLFELLMQEGIRIYPAEPTDATDPVTWTSDNNSIATVSDGVVTAVARGTATITAEAN